MAARIFLRDGEDVVRRLQEDLEDRLVRSAVRPGLQHHEADAEVVPFVDLAVHDEVVHLGMLQKRPVVGGDQQAHVGNAPALPALLPDVLADDILIRGLGGHILGVVALGHDVGQCLHHGGKSLHSGPVRSHADILTLSDGNRPEIRRSLLRNR